VRERAPIARGPNRGGYHEDGSLFVGRFVGPVLFARCACVARFDSPCGAACGGVRFAGSDAYCSWVGYTVDPIWAVPANASDGAAHAARVTLLQQVEKGRQFLGEVAGRERVAPGEKFLAGDLVPGDCCGDFAAERHSLNICC